MVFRSTDILIVGGGLAGLVNAIHLAREGLQVVLVEKKSYPFHKVCGEYISKEILPYLQSLEIDLTELGYQDIKRLQLTSPSGKLLETPLPLGAISISRYKLDHFLYIQALKHGVTVHVNTTVNHVMFRHDEFTIELSEGKSYKSPVVIGAYGKRSQLDRVFQRPFFLQRSPYLGVKYHRLLEHPNDLVSLHNFQSGYCGVSMVENNIVNVCYMVDNQLLRKYKTIPILESEVLCKNPHLKYLFTHSRSIFEKPLVINEISFYPKKQVVDHMLMSGDAAGLITPLCGNGMAMAIRSAQILSELILDYFQHTMDRQTLEERYTIIWHKHFARRLWIGRNIQKSFENRTFSESALSILSIFPGMLSHIIKLTHGQSISKEPMCHYYS